MDIRFCEITKESIPDGEFEAGRAVTVGGKSYYVSAALQRMMARSRVRGWLTFLLVLYAAGVTTFLLLTELKREKPNPDAVSQAVVAEIERRDKRLESHLTQLYSEKVDGFAGEVRDALAAAEKHRGTIHDATADLASRLDEQTKEVKEQIEGRDNRQGRVEDQIEEVRRWLLNIQGTADELLKRQAEMEAQRAAQPAAPAKPDGPVATAPKTEPDANAPDPEHEAQVKMWIERLKDKNNDLVFTATVKLADLKDLRATQPLIVVLAKHKDFYARLGAATALGTLQAVDAVPALIDALGDKDELVRTAANEALIAITSNDQNFAADMSRNERQKVQRKYRTWFKNNEMELRRKLDQLPDSPTRPK
ncbi:MAG: HEAT repeat domain-containing protein [Planctomycetota bacterium]|nr:HEAT repeat domain-containing protein [Planctomycetota bacterium]